jgi:uncharacterized membrane protein YecN with MAPEG domain
MGDNSEKGASDPLYLATRAQMNFAENVPLALAIALLAELNGANKSYIHYSLGALLAFRIAHVELGLNVNNTMGAGRPVGFYGTQAVVAGLAGYIVYLVKDFWQAS